MAERGEQFRDEILPLREVSSLSVRLDPLAVGAGEPERPVSSASLLSNSQYVPEWQHDVDLNFCSPLPPPPIPTSMVTRFFRYLFRSRKIEPTEIRPQDAKCDENHLPILYNKRYNIRGSRFLGLPTQSLLFNKPARVFSAIKGVTIAIAITK